MIHSIFWDSLFIYIELNHLMDLMALLDLVLEMIKTCFQLGISATYYSLLFKF